MLPLSSRKLLKYLRRKSRWSESKLMILRRLRSAETSMDSSTIFLTSSVSTESHPKRTPTFSTEISSTEVPSQSRSFSHCYPGRCAIHNTFTWLAAITRRCLWTKCTDSSVKCSQSMIRRLTTCSVNYFVSSQFAVLSTKRWWFAMVVCFRTMVLPLSRFKQLIADESLQSLALCVNSCGLILKTLPEDLCQSEALAPNSDPTWQRNFWKKTSWVRISLISLELLVRSHEVKQEGYEY